MRPYLNLLLLLLFQMVRFIEIFIYIWMLKKSSHQYRVGWDIYSGRCKINFILLPVPSGNARLLTLRVINFS